MIEELLIGVLREAADEASAVLGDAPPPERIELTRPPNKDFGDFSSNLALVWASRLGADPRDVAQAVIDHLPSDALIERAEVAGPGFVNLFVKPTWLHDAIRDAALADDRYGRADPNGKRVQVEFVSANPTGPLTIGHARNAAIGDTLARMLEATGWSVEREYYFNDSGGQMDRFGSSVEARYLQLLGREAEVPEDGYHGDYVADIAKQILEHHGPGLADLPDEERFLQMREYGAGIAMGWIRETLARFGVGFDTYMHEATLSELGEIEEGIAKLRAAGAIYDADGAVWFVAGHLTEVTPSIVRITTSVTPAISTVTPTSGLVTTESGDTERHACGVQQSGGEIQVVAVDRVHKYATRCFTGRCDDRHSRSAEHLADAADVLREPRLDLAGLPRREEAQRHPLKVLVQDLAEVVHHPLADRAREIRLDEAEDPSDEDEPHHQPDERREQTDSRLARGREERAVEDGLREQRSGHAEARDGEDHPDEEHDARPVWAQQPKGAR